MATGPYSPCRSLRPASLRWAGRFSQVFRGERIRLGKPGNEAGFPGNQAEQEKIPETEERGRCGEALLVNRPRLYVPRHILRDGCGFPLDAPPRVRLGGACSRVRLACRQRGG